MTPNPPPEVGFVYRDQYGNQTILSMTIDFYDSEFEGIFNACKKFMAVIFCEANVEDAIIQEAEMIQARDGNHLDKDFDDTELDDDPAYQEGKE